MTSTSAEPPLPSTELTILQAGHVVSAAHVAGLHIQPQDSSPSGLDVETDSVYTAAYQQAQSSDIRTVPDVHVLSLVSQPSSSVAVVGPSGSDSRSQPEVSGGVHFTNVSGPYNPCDSNVAADNYQGDTGVDSGNLPPFNNSTSNSQIRTAPVGLHHPTGEQGTECSDLSSEFGVESSLSRLREKRGQELGFSSCGAVGYQGCGLSAFRCDVQRKRREQYLDGNSPSGPSLLLTSKLSSVGGRGQDSCSRLHEVNDPCHFDDHLDSAQSAPVETDGNRRAPGLGRPDESPASQSQQITKIKKKRSALRRFFGSDSSSDSSGSDHKEVSRPSGKSKRWLMTRFLRSIILSDSSSSEYSDGDSDWPSTVNSGVSPVRGTDHKEIPAASSSEQLLWNASQDHKSNLSVDVTTAAAAASRATPARQARSQNEPQIESLSCSTTNMHKKQPETEFGKQHISETGERRDVLGISKDSSISSEELARQTSQSTLEKTMPKDVCSPHTSRESNKVNTFTMDLENRAYDIASSETVFAQSVSKLDLRERHGGQTPGHQIEQAGFGPGIVESAESFYNLHVLGSSQERTKCQNDSLENAVLNNVSNPDPAGKQSTQNSVSMITGHRRYRALYSSVSDGCTENEPTLLRPSHRNIHSGDQISEAHHTSTDNELYQSNGDFGTYHGVSGAAGANAGGGRGVSDSSKLKGESYHSQEHLSVSCQGLDRNVTSCLHLHRHDCHSVSFLAHQAEVHTPTSSQTVFVSDDSLAVGTIIPDRIDHQDRENISQHPSLTSSECQQAAVSDAQGKYDDVGISESGLLFAKDYYGQNAKGSQRESISSQSLAVAVLSVEAAEADRNRGGDSGAVNDTAGTVSAGGGQTDSDCPCGSSVRGAHSLYGIENEAVDDDDDDEVEEEEEDDDDSSHSGTSMLQSKRKPRSRLKKFLTTFLSLSSSSSDDENCDNRTWSSKSSGW